MLTCPDSTRKIKWPLHTSTSTQATFPITLRLQVYLKSLERKMRKKVIRQERIIKNKTILVVWKDNVTTTKILLFKRKTTMRAVKKGNYRK